MHWKIFLILTLIISLLISCEKENTLPVNKSVSYTKDGDAALIIVVENRYMLGETTEQAFQSYKKPMLEILSDLFNIEQSKMENMTLTEIVEKYGEPWQINEIKKIAKPFYKKIIALTDESADGQIFIDSVEKLSDDGYYIDLIFSLHGSSNSVVFSKSVWTISALTSDIEKLGDHIRSLYQTCCYGKDMIDDWERINTIAVNGAKGNNGINIFSPIYFLENWTGGMTFKDAVENAYQREIEKLKTYDKILPISDFFLNKKNLDESIQLTGGLDDKLLWKNFPIDYSNAYTFFKLTPFGD